MDAWYVHIHYIHRLTFFFSFPASIIAHLVGPNRSINEKMVKNLRVGVHVVGRDMPPPRDADAVRTFGDLLPQPALGGGYWACVLISGPSKRVDSAVKVIAHILSEKAYIGDDKEAFKQKLLTSEDKMKAEVTIAESLVKSTTSTMAQPTATRANIDEYSETLKQEQQQSVVPQTEYRLPEWLKYSDIRGILEGENKDIEVKHSCTVCIADNKSPMRIIVKSSSLADDRGSRWKTWYSLSDRIACALDNRVRPKFLYDVIVDNYDGKVENAKHPVMRCRSPFDPDQIITMVAISLPNEGNYAGYVIGTKGSTRKRIEGLGCKFALYDRSEQPTGQYVFVSGEVRDAVKAARDIIQARIDEYREIWSEELEQEQASAPEAIYQQHQHQQLLPAEVISGIEAIVRENEPLNLDQLKRLYLAKFRTKLDQTEFGYFGLRDLIEDVPGIQMEESYEDWRPRPTCKYILRMAEEQEGKRTIPIFDREKFIGKNWSQIKYWQRKYDHRGVNISVKENVAIIAGPEAVLDQVEMELRTWQEQSIDEAVIFGGVGLTTKR